MTLLTDLKNHSNADGRQEGRGEFHSSYKAWLLYADLMLQIGHECFQWNRGIHTNENYMFRRWLRKFSEVFDWQERRLHALTLALEAAAGTNSTGAFIDWMMRRALERETKGEDEKIFEKGRWKVRNKQPATDDDQEQTEENDSNADEPDENSQDQSPTNPLESEEQIMRAKQQVELEEFDKTTADMDVASATKASQSREDSRNELIKMHCDAIETLRKEYSKKAPADAVATSEKATPDEINHDAMIARDQDPLPMSASCRQVCIIASELMRDLHGLELYSGARLVAEAVSAYFKERASNYDRRVRTRQRRDDWQVKVAKSPFLAETYEDVSLCIGFCFVCRMYPRPIIIAHDFSAIGSTGQ